MSIEAPACGINGCTTPSWGPCQRHYIPAPEPVAEVWQQMSLFNSAQSETPQPGSAREFAYGLIHDAMRQECIRIFPLIDSNDARSRDQQLFHLRDALVEHLLPWDYEAPTFEFDNLVAWLNEQETLPSEETNLPVGKLLVSFHLRCEWNLARAMGFHTDAYGVNLHQPFEFYAEACRPIFREIALDLFADAMGHYRDVIAIINEREPLSAHPLPYELFLKGQERHQFLAHHAHQAQLAAQAAQRAERSRDRKLKLAQFALNAFEEYNSPQARQTRAIERDRQEARDARAARERRSVAEFKQRRAERSQRTEYLGHLNRKHRRNEGWPF